MSDANPYDDRPPVPSEGHVVRTFLPTPARTAVLVAIMVVAFATLITSAIVRAPQPPPVIAVVAPIVAVSAYGVLATVWSRHDAESGHTVRHPHRRERWRDALILVIWIGASWYGVNNPDTGAAPWLLASFMSAVAWYATPTPRNEPRSSASSHS